MKMLKHILRWIGCCLIIPVICIAIYCPFALVKFGINIDTIIVTEAVCLLLLFGTGIFFATLEKN